MAAWHTCFCEASWAIFSTNSKFKPKIAAIAPTPIGTAFCIDLPLNLNNRAVSAKSNAPAAHNAEYSPKEWPAKYLTVSDDMPSSSIALKVAIDVAIKAG